MSHRMPSRKLVASLAAAGCWSADDVVLAGTDGHGRPMQIARGQAAVPSSLVRRWLLVKDAAGEPRLRVVRDFVAGDGCLFTVAGTEARAAAAVARRGPAAASA